jgi:heme/copper-type cytochrome/quinol oxidase subunit 2
MEQSLVFLEFEYIFAIAVIFVLILMILFYVVYPYDRTEL